MAANRERVQPATTSLPIGRLLYFSPFASGGLADYARAQAIALSMAGAEVVFLTSRHNRIVPPGSCSVIKDLYATDGRKPFRSALARKIVAAWTIASNYRQLVRTVSHGRFRHVLFASYAEYLAPLWAPALCKLAREGVRFGAVLHDPVRDHVLGPRWWHRWSVACAYSFLHEAFVHDAIDLDTVRPMPRLRTTVIPHGPYQFPVSRRSRMKVRATLGLPESAKVLLAFGYVRDGKNIDLALRALIDEPSIYLVVAGTTPTATQRPIAYYQKLAQELGAAPRCRWLAYFIPADQIGDLFLASDAVLLTYSSTFRSASGVLNSAVAYRRPCIASAGQGNLRSMVRKYDLGVFVEPDSVDAIRNAMRCWQAGLPEPRWADYEKDNAWEKNAELVCDRLWT
jgi:glycosyltransferase involved in cell wall biosynthesis